MLSIFALNGMPNNWVCVSDAWITYNVFGFDLKIHDPALQDLCPFLDNDLMIVQLIVDDHTSIFVSSAEEPCGRVIKPVIHTDEMEPILLHAWPESRTYYSRNDMFLCAEHLINKSAHRNILSLQASFALIRI